MHLKDLDELNQIINNNVSITADASNIVLLRLDYSQWYSPVIFDSVFYGSVVASMLLCGSVFIINIIWIIVQKIGLAIIRRRGKQFNINYLLIIDFFQKKEKGLNHFCKLWRYTDKAR